LPSLGMTNGTPDEFSPPDLIRIRLPAAGYEEAEPAMIYQRGWEDEFDLSSSEEKYL